MKVYRFERNGYGPYTFKSPEPVKDKRLNKQIDVHEGWSSEAYKKWPTADADYIPPYMAIGCPSLEALTTWFDGMVGSLVRCGFRIRVYEVPDELVCMGMSGKQLGFTHDEIERTIR